MGIYTNFIMGFICRAINKAPCFFSKRLKEAGDAYYYHKNIIDNGNDINDSEHITHYSLLYPGYNWTVTGVQNLQPLSMNSALNAIQWYERNSTWKKEKREINPSISRETWIDRFFFRDGFTEKIPVHRTILTNSKLVSHCFLSVIELKGGYYFLSTHWFFTNEVTGLLQRVAVDDIPLRTIEYETCNPFRHNFSAARQPGRINKSEERISENINIIYQEIKRLEKKIHKRLGINKVQEGIFTLEMYNDNDKTYFDRDLPDAFRGNFRTDRHAIITTVSESSIIIKDDKCKAFLIKLKSLKKSKIPYLAINSTPKPDSNIFINKIYHHELAITAMQSLHIFQFSFLLNHQFREIVKKNSKSIAMSYQLPGKHYNNLYNANIKLREVIHQAKMLLENNFFNVFNTKEEYIKRMHEIISLRLSEFESLNENIEEKKQVCNEKILAENLNYQKKMTNLVALLALIQVLIAIASLKEPSLGELWDNVWYTTTLWLGFGN
ncbi:hypothetical protein [Aeromonas hydrophila]